MDWVARTVTFDTERCTACGLCTKVCPVRAMHVEVENGPW
jgi:NAD-dependent dihydropyrimidine dehydrogenase PreA subunit